MGPKRQGWSSSGRRRPGPPGAAPGREGREGREGRTAGTRTRRPGTRTRRPATRPPAPEPRPSLRGVWVAAALATGLCLAPLLAGCGADQAPEATTEVLLQPADTPGPGPYTPSTARVLAVPEPRAVAAGAPAHGAPLRGQTLRTVSGGTPGLYGGVEAVGSCDTGRLLDLLRAQPVAARAFARGAGVAEARLPGLLDGLTPVVLRADTRVGAHHYRDGADVTRQAVLQAGTPVLVDAHGMPRVRCAGGNPLSPPVAARGPVVHRGAPWAGHRPERALVVRPADRALDRLVLLDVVDGSWIERRVGTDGERDSRPDPLPPVTEDDLYSYPPAGPAAPEEPAAAEPAPAGGGDTVPGTVPAPTAGSEQAAPAVPAPPDPATAADGDAADPATEPLLDGGAGAAETELLLPVGEEEPDGTVGEEAAESAPRP
ncbi:DUF6777 domain-containing protein [Streptomyces yaizuensis]|uniref:DUF6777 domain-containing protein n=1 Tax=Streptomyces yaizuensis TaxID=2989713 RepID=A0ABQ5NQW6_9ACTN|nr:DUF6777 domain-containing protein [Streptomyces sp. YSPA8]GLF92773.1 hypothetical protein SYYSPA8_00770 [Streptomyces sp. YSPA8]